MISFKNVIVEYTSATETTVAVKDASGLIATGGLVGIVGPSGSGKSTLLAVLGGLLTATSGSININEAQLATMNSRERAEMRLRHIGFVPQEASLLPGMSVLENVAIAAQLQGRSRRDSESEADALMEQLELSGLTNRFPSELSGGQRQRVSIARGLIGGRSVLLVDEPTASLDADSAERVLDLLQLASHRGATVAVATHDHRVIKRVERCIHLRDGVVVDA